MGRFMIVGIFAMIMTLFVQGCSTSTMDQQALEIAMNFKKAQYEISDYTQVNDLDKSFDFSEYVALSDGVKPYVTEKVYQGIMRNRESLFIIQVAKGRKANIKLKNLSMEKITEENGKTTYHYIMELELTYADGKPNKVIKTNGQMDVIKEGEQLKISRDHDSNPLMEEYKAIQSDQPESDS